MSSFQENIHIAIIGPVSAGKSTLLNALFSNTFSDMKRKKTTMLPQIYQTVIDGNKVDTEENIKQLNTESNNMILKLRESGQYNHQSHFKELVYHVKPINDFIELSDKNATYSVLDMPGLNCSGDGNKIYYDYLLQNSHKIDIYVLVFDINSGLNTTDEENILKEINKYIATNKHGYVHVLANKCDEIEFNTPYKFIFSDEEVKELYERSIEIVDKNIKDINGIVSKSPICSSELYVYRSAINNINTIDEKQLDDLIKRECGKKEFTELNKNGLEAKRKYVKGLIKEKKVCNDWMKDTGYCLFKKSMNDILNNYQKIILYHIEQCVDKLLNKIRLNENNIDDITSELEIINGRLQNLSSSIDNKCKVIEIIPVSIRTKLDEITQKLNTFIIIGLNTYTGKDIITVNSFIDKVKILWDKVKSMFVLNPLETSHEKLKLKRIELLNNKLSESFDKDIFTELYSTKMLDLTKYTSCITNTIDKNLIKFDILLNSVNTITANDTSLMNIIIDKFVSSYKINTFNEFIFNLKLIALSTKNNLEIMLKVIQKYFIDSNFSTNKCRLTTQQQYSYWLKINQHKFVNNCDEIKYVYYKLNSIIQYVNLRCIHNTGQKGGEYIHSVHCIDTLDSFKSSQSSMSDFYNLMIQLFEKTPEIINVPHLKVDNNKLVDMPDIMDDEFHDASDKKSSDENSNENSNKYNDSDDSDTVYKKTMKNTKTRTQRRVNTGK